MSKHGGFHYSNDGCRCDICTAAHRENVRKARYRRAERLKADPTLAPHGRATTYGNWMCRCDPCTKAWSQASVAQARSRRAEKEQA